MNRRSFIKNLALGTAALPVAVLTKKQDEPIYEIANVDRVRRRVGTKSFPLPADCGKVMGLAHSADHIWVACENGVYNLPMSAFKE